MTHEMSPQPFDGFLESVTEATYADFRGRPGGRRGQSGQRGHLSRHHLITPSHNHPLIPDRSSPRHPHGPRRLREEHRGRRSPIRLGLHAHGALRGHH